MMFEEVFSLPTGAPSIFISVLILVTGFLISNRYNNGLHRIPGPFLASLTDLWRTIDVWKRQTQRTHIELHRKYGPVVRLGPNSVSVADPQAIKIIYTLKGSFAKSEFYPVQQTVAKGQKLETMFSTTNETFHARLRRAVGNAYAMSTLVQFEPLVDSTITALLKQLDERFVDRADEAGICNFGVWLQYFAFDVIGELTFSKRLGFLDRGEDVDGIIGALERLLDYVSVVGQMPIIDKMFVKNPLRLWISKLGLTNTTTPVAEFARARIAERAELGAHEEKVLATAKSRDFLSRFQEAHKKDPEFVPQQRVLALTVANMFAGSDTTAVSLRTIFYNLLRHPKAMQKLLEEIESNDLFSEGLPKWSDVRELPYLSAVIKEALRCHPATGLTLERVVPAAGVEICGHHLPAGTIVGCNAWVVHQDEQVFGAQPEQFRPERWIGATEEQKNDMNNMLLSFGAGSRACIGRNVSLLEIYKLVPALLHRYELSLADPEAEWKLHNAWFVRQTEFYVRLKSRK
ncbi:pisatin demethylase [Plenodomus tracheiphilus IPT5]|uniref:Pisatin demethylase n=1 Tax=Plenodomus tracheiphilus IPT5 TaxID=1408161 RepID=A0A6A7B6L3_9PLEO|nr:pisatin demethylase [Plenodomus tracheiphilus IPT5]